MVWALRRTITRTARSCDAKRLDSPKQLSSADNAAMIKITQLLLLYDRAAVGNLSEFLASDGPRSCRKTGIDDIL